MEYKMAKSPKKEEMNDIIQYLIPKLSDINISKEYLKIDVTTKVSKQQRGDIWISTSKQTDTNFEKNIICLIEAKHKKSNIGDIDWRDAMRQGKEKAIKQKLKSYAVTNCISDFRFYNVLKDDEEISLDGKVLTKLVDLVVLQKIQTQLTSNSSEIFHKSKQETNPIYENEFRQILKNISDIYRSAGLKKGDQSIDPTISFIILKYISEQENKSRTLDGLIKLWDDFKNIVNGEENRDLSTEFNTVVEQIWGDSSAYKTNVYKDFKDLIKFPAKLRHRHFVLIYKILDAHSYHGANFDLFGSIYEEFASSNKKKEFGQFYTRRHITGITARLLLRNENIPRNMKICDPSCGTGGFLTESFKTLNRNYTTNSNLNKKTRDNLKHNTFWGFDNDDKSIARTKLNMFLAGDGHTHIFENDSLMNWNSTINWNECEFDYILANPPMGKYSGDAELSNYVYTNESRYQLLFLERIIKATTPGGHIAVVVDDGTLETPTREKFRKKLLQNCDIHAIVSLTKFAFAPYTKEKTYILFMQKKQIDDIGTIQHFPIWNYILDYDGYANSDKRYKTKYHDDLPELEEIFAEAVKFSKKHIEDEEDFNNNKSLYQRDVNEREIEEGLHGLKFGHIAITEINESNFYNLLSEFHLRPYQLKKIAINEFENKISEINKKIKKILKQVK